MTSDVFTPYEIALRELVERLGKDHSRYGEALVLQQRLQENLAQARRYGDTETRRAERAQILDGLNGLAIDALGVPFNELAPQVEPESASAHERPKLVTHIGDADAQGSPLIFLCHAKEDKERVRRLYRDLKAAGLRPWLDEEDLLPGQDWDLEIRRAIRQSDFFLACLSQNATDKRGYVQKEIKMGLDVLDEMPEGHIYLIPVRLEECRVPDRLSPRQWVDLFPSWEQGLHRVFRALKSQGVVLWRPLEPEMVLIPAGEFLMGSDPSVDKYALGNEQPQHRLYLPDYYLARAPVTNAQYAAFATLVRRYREEEWLPRGQENHPVVDVSWYHAMAYCRWLSETTKKTYDLPTEAEWEKGARGIDGRIYPWGNGFGADKCNMHESDFADTTPVGQYSPAGDSPHGLQDMAGNVWEWTRSLYKPYPYQPGDGREDSRAEGARMLRGGGFAGNQWHVRCASRHGVDPNLGLRDYGFRVVLVPPA